MAKKLSSAAVFFRFLKPARMLFFGLFILLNTACQMNPEAQAPSTGLPGSTSLPNPILSPTHTPLPTLPPSPTSPATPIPTGTPIPTPTIQFPLRAGTPLPFTPEPITPQNASRLKNLLSFDLRDLTTAPGSDGSVYYVNKRFRDGLLAFSSDDASLRLLTYKVMPPAPRPQVEMNGCFQSGMGTDVRQEDYKNGEYGLSLLALQIPEGRLSISTPQIPNGSARFFLLPDGSAIATQLFWDYCKFWFTDLSTGEQSKFFFPSRDDYRSRIGFTSNGEKLWAGEISYHNPYNRSPDFAHFSLYDLTNGERSLTTRFDLSQMDLNLDLDKFKDMEKEGYDLSSINNNLESDILAVSEDFLVTAIHNSSGKVFRKNPFGGGVWEVGLYFSRFDLWSLKDGIHLYTLGNPLRCSYQQSSEHTCLAALSADGKILAIKSDDINIRLYSTSDGSLIRELEPAGLDYARLVFTADGKMLAAMTDQFGELWSVSDGKFLVDMSRPGMLAHFAISHDGRYMATVTEDGLIQVWGVAP